MLPSIATGNVASALAGEYEVANSLRFDDGSSDNLTKTFSTDGTSHDIGTVSVWLKRSELGAEQGIFTAGSSNRNFIRFESNDTLTFRSVADSFHLQTTQVFRDSNAWYHIVIAFDTTQSTSSDRVKFYVNGTQVTDFGTETYPALNLDIKLGAAELNAIGKDSEQTNPYYDGYMAEFVYIDGTQLDATSFGEFDEDSGIWKPKNVSSLTFGTNGFHLDFEDSSALGNDVSGNNNDFTANNLTSIDQTTDTCTNNFATLNPLSTVHTENISSMLSEGNTKYDPTGDYSIVKSTIPFPESGKWYVEIKLGTSGTINGQFGVMRIPATSNATNSYIGYATNDAGYAYYNGKVKRSTGGSGDTRTDLATGLASYSSGDTLAMLFNADDNEIKWYVQDSLQYTLDLSSAPHGYYANDGEWVFALSAYGTYNAYNLNFGSPSVSISSGNTDGNGYGNFEFATKGGYALCTKNLAEFG